MSDRPRWKDIEEDQEEQCVDTCPLTSPDHSSSTVSTH